MNYRRHDGQLCGPRRRPAVVVRTARFNPGGLDEPQLDQLNRRLGQAILDNGRVMAGTTLYAGKVALRSAIVNSRTRPEDIDPFVAVVRELTTQIRKFGKFGDRLFNSFLGTGIFQQVRSASKAIRPK